VLSITIRWFVHTQTLKCAAVEHLLRATALAEARHFWFKGFRAFVTPLLRHATRGIRDARLLDCGCGTGANVELLGQFGRAWGFDLSEAGVRIGRELGRTRLVRASVVAAPFPGETFHVVTSFDVLYSLEEADERAAVREMYRLTRPGGYVVVNVAAMNLLRGDHSVLSREVRRYDRPGLRHLLTNAGFTIERLTYTNATLFLPLAAVRAFQRWRGLAAEAQADREITVPPEPVNALVGAALRAESYWLRTFDSPVGSSLLCLARKA
jgi:SAM-dependent methyltransferase